MQLTRGPHGPRPHEARSAEPYEARRSRANPTRRGAPSPPRHCRFTNIPMNQDTTLVSSAPRMAAVHEAI